MGGLGDGGLGDGLFARRVGVVAVGWCAREVSGGNNPVGTDEDGRVRGTGDSDAVGVAGLDGPDWGGLGSNVSGGGM